MVMSGQSDHLDSGPYFDCDSHIVESLENLTRHQPKAFKEKYHLERRETAEGKYPWFLNGRQLEILEDATRPGNLIPKPGALKSSSAPSSRGRRTTSLSLLVPTS